MSFLSIITGREKKRPTVQQSIDALLMSINCLMVVGKVIPDKQRHMIAQHLYAVADELSAPGQGQPEVRK